MMTDTYAQLAARYKNGAPTSVEAAKDLVALLCQAISQPPRYTNLINLIDYERFGSVYVWSQLDGNVWTIPLKDGSLWKLTIEKQSI
jgi:hypothetical protein